MQYAIPRQLNTARSITRAAEQQIKKKTGITINLMVQPGTNINHAPDQLLKVVADALGMEMSCYKLKSRARDIVELRFVASRLLRSFFPSITLHQITLFFGGQDHSSVINALERSAMLLDTGDVSFTEKYNKALKQVKLWLKKEASGSASAISA